MKSRCDFRWNEALREINPHCRSCAAVVRLSKKPRRVCAVHGTNRFKIIFPGGKWVRLQTRKLCAARLVKTNPCSAYVGKNTLRPASWVRLQTRKRSAAGLAKSNPCSAVDFLCLRHRNYARSRVQSPQMRAQRSGAHLKDCQKRVFDNLKFGCSQS